MRKALGISLALLIASLAACAPAAEPETAETAAVETAPVVVDLFDGATLDGWDAFLSEPGVAKEDVWSVQDGLLVCKGDPIGYLYTKEQYTSFKLEVEWRWAPGTEPGNSGVLMRINGEPKAIPRSIEAQLQSGNAGDLYGFHGMKIAGAEERKRGQQGHELLGDFVGVGKIEGNEVTPGEWNTYEIVLDGGNLTVSVNGKQVNEAVDCDVIAGPIGLQSEGGEIHFRTVRLTPIS